MGKETTQIVGVGDLARYRTSRFSAVSTSSDSKPDRFVLADVAKEVNAKFIK